ncbi:L-amino acid N-acyltransferase YncA [Sporobacter termitidis DSM 10068]|uniref:L-amino acid N-acyltransferase YncA n=1 Tax=Sporobacter termitidis DSM 10068 TaxID=1123282 RepID=A0A1M5Z9H2_9FIRM|nr:GNAT family N-acetyltransferase [Sporobacter termitidis]SHI20870.1 L-amino acid N-acyltransferase YncA [Sporobacter termitidis DSM 10068]
MSEMHVRPAVEADIPLILRFIRELAEYEKLSDQVTATEEILTEWIFKRQRAEALIGEEDGAPVGYALLFHNFSTFLGRAGIYIEDIYVRPEHRKKGYGKAFFKHIAGLCRDRGCGRLEWSCLDWNRPSIDFYLSLGARPMEDWTIYRLNTDSINKLAEDL